MGVDNTDYELELKAVQTWLKASSGLNSWKRTVAPPHLPRPVVLWESPYRGRARNLSRYAYTQTIKYYGKLFINGVDEALDIQNRLVVDLEDRCGTIPILDATGAQAGYIKAAQLVFNETEGLDVPFTLSYEVSYSRKRPEAIPPPKYVYTKVTGDRSSK